MSDRPRIVVSGHGLISPLGIGGAAHWDGRVSGRSGIDRITIFDPGDFDVQVAAEVKGFEPRSMVPQRKAIKVMARDIQLATAAAKLAEESTGIQPGGVEPTRLGVVLGAGLITSEVGELAEAVIASRGEDGRYDPHRFGGAGRDAMFPLWLLKHLPNMPASHISIYFDAQGPNNSITTACAAGIQAIGEASQIIQRGRADVMITGGVDSRIKPLNLIKANGFNVMAKGPEARCRPYDRDRDGMVFGEAAAILVIEREEHARQRSGKALAEICGYGSSGGRFRVLDPVAGATYSPAAIRMALTDAGIEAEQVSAVFGYGIGTQASDAAEARALHSALGAQAGRIPVVGAAGAVGHTWAAAGALAAADAAFALHHSLLPSTTGCQHPDESLGIQVAHGEPQPFDGEYVIVLAHAFGGQDACLVMKRYSGAISGGAW